MNDSTKPGGNRLALLALGLILLLAGGAAGWLWQSRSNPAEAEISAGNRAAVEKVVREYILTHPEILPEAMNNLQMKENVKLLAGLREGLERPFPGATLGNPDGKVTLVVFTDYACSYCRQSEADVAAVIRANADLKVVVRELPILSPDSLEAAKWALSAAGQGRYAAFHSAMFAAGRPDAATLEKVAAYVGLDVARVKGALADPRIGTELDRNIGYARQLGFNGTPSWVIGNRILSGAVGQEALQEAIDEARKAA